MSYSTGAFAGGDDFTTVHSKLSTFAVAQGWTVTSGSYPTLNLHKGTTFVNLTFTTSTLVDDTLNTGASTPDYRITGFLSDAASLGTFPVHKLDPDVVIANDFLGPYANYWFFSGDGVTDPDYIYMVIQKANGRFCALMFGCIDKKGVSYDGGDFLTGVFWQWWFTSSSTASANGSGQGSDPYSLVHGWPGGDTYQYNVRLGDAYPTLPFTSHKFSPSHAYHYGLSPNFKWDHSGPSPYRLEDLSMANFYWQGHFYFLGPNPINGLSPMFEVPLNYFDGYNSSRLMSLGAYPNYRQISMIGRVEAEEVAFGSDNWMVFPIKRYLPYHPEPFSTKTITSGVFGHAFKIIP